MTIINEQILDNWVVINRLATRRFGDRPLAEEAALFVMDGLAENDGSRLRGYNGTSTYTAFFAAVSWQKLWCAVRQQNRDTGIPTTNSGK